MARLSITRTLILALTLAAVPAAAHAQSSLAPADAAEFMGVWTITVEGPQGPIEQELTLKAEADKVVGDITSSFQPEPQRITDITKVGKDLVLNYSGNFEGNPFDARVVVTPTAADQATVAIDINGGQMAISGTGVKKK